MSPRLDRRAEGTPDRPTSERRNPTIRTTVEALGGAQAVPSELIPVRELHQRLIDQVATSGGNVVLADTAGKPAAVVMSLQLYQQLVDELTMLRRRTADNA